MRRHNADPPCSLSDMIIPDIEGLGADDQSIEILWHA